MDLESSTQILKEILVCGLPQYSNKNRYWLKKLIQVSAADEAVSLKLAKVLGSALASNPIVLRIPRGAVALYNAEKLHRLGVEKVEVPGYFSFYAMKEAPDRLLFRKKVAQKGQPFENAAEIIDLRTQEQGQWLEVLPFECRFLEGKLVIRAAEWLERLRLDAEKSILRIKNDEVWKKASPKARAKLEYGSITTFDRILVIDLLRKNFLKLTPACAYFFHSADRHARTSTTKKLHPFILGLTPDNRYRLHPSPKTIARRLEKQKAKALLEKGLKP